MSIKFYMMFGLFYGGLFTNLQARFAIPGNVFQQQMMNYNPYSLTPNGYINLYQNLQTLFEMTENYDEFDGDFEAEIELEIELPIAPVTEGNVQDENSESPEDQNIAEPSQVRTSKSVNSLEESEDEIDTQFSDSKTIDEYDQKILDRFADKLEKRINNKFGNSMNYRNRQKFVRNFHPHDYIFNNQRYLHNNNLMFNNLDPIHQAGF